MVMDVQQSNSIDQTISVGLGEVTVSKDPLKNLACFGLGSCISLCACDPVAKVAGMAHIVLPQSKPGTGDRAATKYADIAVPILFEDMSKSGALKSNIIVKLVGGAQMIQTAGFSNILDMGNRNLEATRQVLKKEGVRITAEDIGGSQGRSVWLSVATGEVMVRTAGKELKKL
ncbi:MAG: chemotaxis protein CheD [Dehalococcoidales bacterium]